MIATVISAVILILLNKKEIKEALKKDNINNLNSSKNMLSRRKFILGSALFGIIGIYNLFRVEFFEKNIKKILFLFLPNSNQLVVNKNTGVIHHKKFCKNHLPKEQNSLENIRISPKIKFHTSKKIQILNHISEDISVEDSIQVLLLAVENNPTSVHLYDKLIKLFGKIKRYESIHLLLSDAQRQLLDKISSSNIKTKEYNKYKKALKHVKLQKKKALERARYKILKS